MGKKSVQDQSWYRWVIVACGICLMAFSMGIVNNCFALYTIPVTQGLGCTRQEFAVNQTLLFVSTMLFASLVGSITHRISVIRGIRIAVIFLAVFYFLYSLATHIWQFYIISAVLGALIPFVTTVPMSLIIAQWFKKDVGLALGIVFMGSGIGGMIFNPVASVLIQRFGWRTAFAVIGIQMFLVLVPIAFFIIKEAPRVCWTASEGGDGGEDTQGREGALTGREFNEELRTARFWFYMLMSMLMGAGTYTIINFTSTYLQDIGYTAYFAASVASVSMGGMALGKPFLGRLYDTLGLKFTTLLSLFFLVLGMFGGSFMNWKISVLFIILGGSLGCPLGSVTPPLLIRHVFGARGYSQKLSLAVAVGNLGAALTPILAGYMYEHVGSYQPMYLIMMFLMIGVFVCYVFALPKKASEL